MSVVPLLLASASPRRRDLLALLGADFDIAVSDIDERAASSPAAAKLEHSAREGATTLAADTLIELDGERIGKPRDHDDAVETLRRLAGRAHEVVTEVALADAAGRRLRFAVRSRVRMRARDDRAIAEYVATGEPLDKAGAYAIQGKGAALVERADGCLANVVGLPLCHVAGALRQAGVAFPSRAHEACQRHFGFQCPVWRRAVAQGRALRDGESYASFDRDHVLPSEVRILRSGT